MTDMVQQAYECGKNPNPGPGFPLPAGALPAATPQAQGAMPAVDYAAGHLSDTITNNGGAVAGDIVRIVSAGVLAKVRANDLATVVGTIGVWDGSTVQPLSGFRTVNCDSAPAVASPLYVSATVAGKASLLPNALALAPIGIVARVISTTQAVVFCQQGAQYLASDDRQIQTALTAAICGCSPATLTTFFTNFELKAAPTGWTIQSVTYNAYGAVCVTTGSSQVLSAGLSAGLSFATFGAFKWSLGQRITLANANTLSMIYLMNSATSASLGIYFSAAAGLQVRYGIGYNPPASLPPSIVQVIDAGVLSTTGKHIVALYSLGNDTFLVRVDGSFYGPYAISQAADFSGAAAVYSVVKDDGGTCGITYGAQWFSGNHRGYAW